MKSRYTSEYLAQWRETHSRSHKDVLISVRSESSTNGHRFIVSFLGYELAFSKMESVLDFINTNLH